MYLSFKDISTERERKKNCERSSSKNSSPRKENEKKKEKGNKWFEGG